MLDDLLCSPNSFAVMARVFFRGEHDYERDEIRYRARYCEHIGMTRSAYRWALDRLSCWGIIDIYRCDIEGCVLVAKNRRKLLSIFCHNKLATTTSTTTSTTSKIIENQPQKIEVIHRARPLQRPLQRPEKVENQYDCGVIHRGLRTHDLGRNKNSKKKSLIHNLSTESEFKEKKVLSPTPLVQRKEKQENKTKKKNSHESSKKKVKFQHPNLSDVSSYMQEYAVLKGLSISLDEPDRFVAFYQSKGWHVGKNMMKDWRAAVRGWTLRNKKKQSKKNDQKGDYFSDALEKMRSKRAR